MIDIDKLPKKAGYIALIAILCATAYFMINRAIKKAREAKDAKDLRNDLNANNLSFDLTQYGVLADKLENNIGPFNTSESAVYAVFTKLSNSDDVKQLIKAFGSRTFTLLTGKCTLVQYMAEGMAANEIEKVNQILTGKGINISF